jgi:hypothetical protein
MTGSSSPAILIITAVGGSDGHRPLRMGAVAQPGVGCFCGHGTVEVMRQTGKSKT